MIEPPSNFWVSEASSRKRQKSLRWSSVAAIAASVDQLPLQPLGEHRLDGLVEPALDLCGRLQQHVPGMRIGQRIARVLAVLQHELQGDALHQLEADDALAELVAREPEQRQRLTRIGETDERGHPGSRLRKQFQGRRRDDPRAFPQSRRTGP